MTKLSDIYESFLSKISDYSFLSENVTQEELDEELFGYFKTARAKFYRCRNSLETVENELGELEFTVELDPMEIEVLTILMVVEYLRPKILTDETLNQFLSDKDVKIYSQASQLRELRLLLKSLKSEASTMITEYTYLELDLDGKDKKK